MTELSGSEADAGSMLGSILAGALYAANEKDQFQEIISNPNNKFFWIKKQMFILGNNETSIGGYNENFFPVNAGNIGNFYLGVY